MKIRKIFIFLLLILVLFGSYQYYLYQKYQDRPMPTDLHPLVKQARDDLIKRTASIGIPILITDDFRSIADQDQIYEQGRTTEGSVVTYAKGGESYHNYGLAIDFALLPQPDQASWDMEYDGNNNGKSDWMEVVEIAKDLGFSWGGDFTRFKDYPHLQMDFGLSIRDLQRGKRPSDVLDE